MIRLINILLFLLAFQANSQKYMIKNGDTLPFIESKLIPCQTFEKFKGEIINIRNKKCLKIGFWREINDDGTIKEGNYSDNGKPKGVWKTFNKNGELIRKIEYAVVGEDYYILKESEFINGREKIISEKSSFTKFYLKNVLMISIILISLFFVRLFINSPIYNDKNKTNYSPIYYFIGPYVSENFVHSIKCTYTFWWNIKRVKSEHKDLAIMNNVISVFCIVSFLLILIMLGISGEINL